MNYRFSSKIERTGVAHCEKLFTKLGFIFREQPVGDFGVDAHIELASESYASGKLIALQIKSGESYFKERKNNSIVFRGEMKHYEYWMNHSLPVILVLFNPETDECIWQVVNSSTVNKTKNSWKLNIPVSNTVESSEKVISGLVKNQSISQKKWSSLVLAKPWISAIENKYIVSLEIEEWVNKTSGRGAITLIVSDIYGEEHERKEWFVFLGLKRYEDAIKELFPWADIHIDSDYYDEYEYEQFEESYGIYDKEEDRYILDPQDFDEYIDELPKFRPYKIDYGEVAYYKLVLSVNELGTAFIKLDTFLHKD